jgi:hypothetical protein
MAAEISPYKTSDTPYAAFLHLNGITPLGVRPDPNDAKRYVFVFIYQDNIPKLEQEYRYGKTAEIKQIKGFYKSLKICTRMVNEEKNK